MTKIESVDVVVVGAGVVGAAVASAFSKKNYEVLIIEKGPRIAEGITSRNSGVVHAGIYYPLKSLKAELCIRGRHLLYEWCAAKNVPFKKTGKLIVGRKELDLEVLTDLYQNAIESGCDGLKWIEGSQNLEKFCANLIANVALYSSESGIVDPFELTRSLISSAEESGALLLTNTKLLNASKQMDRFLIETTRGSINASIVINSAGLESDLVARYMGSSYVISPWRGDYFKLCKKIPTKTLLYPVKRKNDPGLGVHLTFNLNGEQRFGPDAFAIEQKDDFTEPNNIEEKKKIFCNAVRKFILNINEEDLVYDSCGIRPKLRSSLDVRDGDFVIEEKSKGWINLIGIESPGLTSSLAIAEKVLKLI